MAKNKITLIYGGGNKGLMGAVANAVMDNGGNVTGIIPEVLMFDAGNNTDSPYIGYLGSKEPIIRAGFNIYLRPKKK